MNLTGSRRREFAAIQAEPKKLRPSMPCLPRGGGIPCVKEGGVCSIRLYRDDPVRGASVAQDELGSAVTTCPCRFEENGKVFQWIGEAILQCPDPLVASEIGFLESERSRLDSVTGHGGREDVGRIDNVLVYPRLDPMAWCALEVQAVYFSGYAMSHEFRAILTHEGEGLPFPVKIRRPDFRSSGPKRLMPQLQIKVPTLRRWGKKMAVVVDEAFFSALGRMNPVRDVSNSDIAWFVIGFDESAGEARLKLVTVHLTTLEDAVVGLTAGHPVSLGLFEQRIREKISRSPSRHLASEDPG